MPSESKTVIYAAIGGNLCVAIAKFVAAAFTASSAMIAEGIHSLVDTGNGLLLLLGIRLSKRPPDEDHPFGHGLELYFWTLIVSIMVFGVGGGVSVYEGILHLMPPTEMTNVVWNYSVLGVAAVFEGAAWLFALRGFWRAKGTRGIWATIRTTKDPTIFAVLFEDTAALLGLIVAAAGIYLSHTLGHPLFDGAASIVIGLILMAVSSVLAYESRALLLGESADPEMVEAIRKLAQASPAVEHVQKPLTMHFGPHDVLVNLALKFRGSLSTADVERAIDQLERDIRQQYPDVKRIFLEAESLSKSERQKP